MKDNTFIQISLLTAMTTTAWMSGCASPSATRTAGTTVTGPTSVAANGTVNVNSATSGNGSLSVALDLLDGNTRTVQFLPRAKTFSDIKSLKFDILDPDSLATKFSAVSNTVKSNYLLSNLAAPKTIKLRITTYSSENATGTVLNSGGTGTISNSVSIVDQTVTKLALSLALLDGFVANGDLAATVSITNGTTNPLPPLTVN